MSRQSMLLILLLMPLAGAPARAADEVVASYDTYAAGLNVAEVEAGFVIGPWSYQMRLAYHTTGLAGLLFSGHQVSQVDGTWRANAPMPHSYAGEGVWRSRQRTTRIDYQDGRPLVRALAPPNEDERETVPEALRANSIDTLSALVELVRRVADTGRCDSVARTYDGRRAVEIVATTAGEEVLAPTSRSSFSGPALRCDFAGRLLAGFLHTDDRACESKPLHGSAWLARVVPGGAPLPVRMAFETRWFGDATMYLRSITTDGQAIAQVH
jgi:hypothetical protein